MAFQTEAAGRRAPTAFSAQIQSSNFWVRQAIGLKPPTISALLRLISARFNLVA
jgi:hypothetical protein